MIPFCFIFQKVALLSQGRKKQLDIFLETKVISGAQFPQDISNTSLKGEKGTK